MKTLFTVLSLAFPISAFAFTVTVNYHDNGTEQVYTDFNTSTNTGKYWVDHSSVAPRFSQGRIYFSISGCDDVYADISDSLWITTESALKRLQKREISAIEFSNSGTTGPEDQVIQKVSVKKAGAKPDGELYDSKPSSCGN